MATVNVVLRTDKKPDRESKYPVYIRVHYKKPIYYYTGIKVREEDWNNRSDSVRASEDKHAVYNNIINEEYTRIDNAIINLTRNGKKPPVTKVKNIVQKNDEPSRQIDFIAYCEQWLSKNKGEFSLNTAKSLKNSLQRLKKFSGGMLPFDDIDLQLVKRYNRYLTQDAGNKKTTAHIRLSFMQRMYKEAIKDGYADQATNPFFIYDIEKGSSEDPVHLNLSEISQIAKLDLEKGSYIWHVRNGFMLSFWCAGIRISDLCLLDWVKNIKEWDTDMPILDYIMKKNGKRRVFPLLPPAVDILKHYEPSIKKLNSDNFVFPFIPNTVPYQEGRPIEESISQISSNNNRTYLPKIENLAGINKHITNHTSRHSFAACFEELELPVEALQELLAHSDLKTTEAYRKKLGVAITKRSRKSLNQFFDRFQKAQNM